MKARRCKGCGGRLRSAAELAKYLREAVAKARAADARRKAARRGGAVIAVADLRLGWSLVVDQGGCPLLVGPGRQRAPLFSISEQPRTCRLLLARTERWLSVAERTYVIDDPILLAVRWARARLVEYLSVTEASCAAVA